VTIAKDATKYMLGAPVNIAVILGSSAESPEALALVCCCIIVLRAAAKDGREAFALYASQRKAQFLTEEESKPAKEWAVASVSVFNIPDWLENINVSIVNLYGEKSLVLERQNLLRNQQRMGASASWKDEEMPIVKGEVYIVVEKCIVNPGEVQEPRLFGAYGCLLPESPHLQKMLASSSGAHYLDLSIDQCDVFDSRLENTGDDGRDRCPAQMAYSDDEEMSDEGNQRPMVVSMIPDTLNSHQLRCCLRCHIILSVSQFVRHGCPNCQDIDMEGDKTLVEDYTTKNFSGGVSVMNPARSWVARQLKLSTFCAGMYAVAAQGDGEAQGDYDDEYEEDY
ncbi:Transcription elongation factor SPT4, partial [Perkinsus olseni]